MCITRMHQIFMLHKLNATPLNFYCILTRLAMQIHLF
uniref:Uncharacterized protein n=1 Tax=Rhizophora mucronata TaxID=61149 RepID=A0A2P2PWY6_RHIMU